MDEILETRRLRLRPFALPDASAVQELAGNRNVAHMVGRIPHPYPDRLAEEWIASHADLRAQGQEYSFAVDHAQRLIGAVSLTKGAGAGLALGYWIGEPLWGQGFATEAALRMVRFGFETLDIEELVASHRVENAASARVLEKCGFRYTGDGMQWSAALGREIAVRRLALARKPLTLNQRPA